MVTNDDRTVHLALEVTNYGNVPKLFVPSQIVVVLPNGHSYRPYNRADVLDQAYAAKNTAKAQAYSGYNPPPVTQYNTDCSLTGNTAFCRTTPDVSAQAGYAVGFALGAAIRTLIAEHTFNKYIKQIQEEYLGSQEISPKAKVIGYVDLYVEDTHAGPFTVRIPAGDKVDNSTGILLPESMSFYNFVFGPEVINVDFPKMSCGHDGCEVKH